VDGAKETAGITFVTRRAGLLHLQQDAVGVTIDLNREHPLLVAAGLTMLTIGLLWLQFRRNTMRVRSLAGVSAFYAAFVLFVGIYFKA